ncbi:hypothetical protein HYT55_02720 [Candidatus Woesearchaeota archaeon]|nr:hypothetical protein [Candidatus Woesearchaeota archaeon]
MGLFDKLFHRKDGDLDFDQIAQKELGNDFPGAQPDLFNTPPPGFEEEKSAFEMPQSPPPARFPGAAPLRTISSPVAPPTSENLNRDLELINSKLDTIKALIASLDQRLANVERTTGSPPQRQQQRLW